MDPQLVMVHFLSLQIPVAPEGENWHWNPRVPQLLTEEGGARVSQIRCDEQTSQKTAPSEVRSIAWQTPLI